MTQLTNTRHSKNNGDAEPRPKTERLSKKPLMVRMIDDTFHHTVMQTILFYNSVYYLALKFKQIKNKVPF